MSHTTTLKDIAKVLNVSIATVSKALNNSYEISEETRKKVVEIANSLNYIPNATARSLKSNRTKRIGVIVPNIESDFFAKVIRAIESEAAKENYKVIICLSNDLHKKEVEGVSILLNGSVDGLIISLSQETQDLGLYSHLETFSQRKFPIVMFDRVCEEIECDKITINDFKATFDATKYVYSKGCKNIAFLSTISQTSVGESRKNGYLKALEELNIKTNTIIEIPDYDQFDSILGDALKSQKIDAILAADQMSAISTLSVVQNNGFRIPDDISVLGFTDGLVPKYTIPSLTTISQKAESMGSLAFTNLFERIEDKEKPYSHKILETEFIKRQSTR